MFVLYLPNRRYVISNLNSNAVSNINVKLNPRHFVMHFNLNIPWKKNGRYTSHHALRIWCDVPSSFSGYTPVHWKFITVIYKTITKLLSTYRCTHGGQQLRTMLKHIRYTSSLSLTTLILMSNKEIKNICTTLKQTDQRISLPNNISFKNLV